MKKSQSSKSSSRRGGSRPAETSSRGGSRTSQGAERESANPNTRQKR